MSLASIPSAFGAEILASKKGITTNGTPFQKFKYMVTHITVEPVIFLCMLPWIMNSLTTQNLNLEKACRVNLKYNSSVCDALANRNHSGYEVFHEEEVQKLVSKMMSIKMTIVGSYPALLMLFLGSWSDRTGLRKPLILMPVLGEMVTSTCLFICSYFFLELPVEYSMLSETIPTALGGTLACCFLGVYTYICTIATDSDRTARIGAVTLTQNISFTLGIFLSGIMIKLIHFKGVYILSFTLLAITFFYGVFVLKECNIVEKKKKTEQKDNFFTDFFSTKHIVNTFRICFQEGKNKRRPKMFVLMFLSMMIMGPFHGEVSVVYLYTRLKCGWNEVDYSIFNSLVSVIQVFGGVFAIAFFSKLLRMEDALLGVIAMASKIGACLIFAFATSGKYFYIGAFVEVFHGASHIALRSLMGKIVPPHELGQSNSVFGVFEAVTPLIFGSFYTMLYNYTIAIFPGTFYLFTAVLYLITISLFLTMYKWTKEDRVREAEEEIHQKEKLLETKDKIDIKSKEISD